MVIEDIMFNGGAGRLEGKLFLSQDPTNPAALILHPHPLHGNMNNKVVYKMFHTFVQNDCTVMRFNFRGVGKSEGQYDSGIGEMLDAALALDYLINKAPEASNYWVCGFSFGAWIALQILMRRPETKKFIIVAPPASSHDFSFIACPAEGLFIHGTKDEIVEETAAYELYTKLNKQRGSDVTYMPVDADHFFTDKLEEIEEIMHSYIQQSVNNAEQPIFKVRRDRKRRNKVLMEE